MLFLLFLAMTQILCIANYQPGNNDLAKQKMDSQGSEKLIIIDTDCGIDDAMAIMLGLSFKESTRILALTCCAGNTDLENVCNNVRKVLVVCKENKIPVYRGSGGPLVFPFVDPHSEVIHGYDGLGNVSDEYPTGDIQIQKTTAASALVDYARKYPQQIYLVAIGPLTNIALAMKLDPNFTRNLKGLVLLGGNHKGVGNTNDAAEFNFAFDPESAHIVMTESLCPVTMVPWETVMKNGLDWEDYKGFLKYVADCKTERSRFLVKLLSYADDAFKKNKDKRFYDCDLLAVAAIVQPECIDTYEEFPVTVECSGQYTRGQAVVKRRSRKGKSIKIITGFKDEMINQLRMRNARDDVV